MDLKSTAGVRSGEWRPRVAIVVALLVGVLVASSCEVPSGSNGVVSGALDGGWTTTPAPQPTTPATTSTTEAPPINPIPYTIDAYRGVGTWMDVFDWSITYSSRFGNPVKLADVDRSVDRMAAMGVETLYLQGGRWDWEGEGDLVEPERLNRIIDRAHRRGMAVIMWYLPMHADPEEDLRRLLALAALPVEGLAVDIEGDQVKNIALRNQRLLELTDDLDEALRGEPLGAITFPPVAIEDINATVWPDFPWRTLADTYDVFMPMAYSSFRTVDSGWRDGYAYTKENINRVRINTGRPGLHVHAIGGIPDVLTNDDISGIVRAAEERRAIGVSLYDFATSSDAQTRIVAGFEAR